MRSRPSYQTPPQKLPPQLGASVKRRRHHLSYSTFWGNSGQQAEALQPVQELDWSLSVSESGELRQLRADALRDSIYPRC